MANTWLRKSAADFGINHIHHYSHEQFCGTAFYNQHFSITSEPFGAGLYLWKPYYILQTLQQLNDDDILMYIDSGQVLIADPQPLYDLAVTQEIMLFENSQGYLFFSKTDLPFNYENCYKNINNLKYWCKSDALVNMQADNESIHASPLLDASLMLFKKGPKAIDFVTQWLHHCCNPSNINWDASISKPDSKSLIFHVYDQSILSVLAAMQKLPVFRCPSQFGNHFKQIDYRVSNEYLLLPYAQVPFINSPYGTITWHHRTKQRRLYLRVKDFLYREMIIFNTTVIRNRWSWLNRKLSAAPYNFF